MTNPNYWLQERELEIPPPRHRYRERSYSRSDSRDNTDRRPVDPGLQAVSHERGIVNRSHGHVRKRSDEVGALPGRLKRTKLGDAAALNISPRDNPNLMPLPQVRRSSSPSAGRLTPWSLPESQPQDAENPDCMDTDSDMPHSRGDRVAELESESFLAELSIDIEHAMQPRASQMTRAGLACAFVPSNHPTYSERDEDDTTMQSASEEGEIYSSDEGVSQVTAMERDMLNNSPSTLRTLAPRQFPVASTSPNPQAQYHPAVNALFDRRTKVSIRKPLRPRAIDYW